MTSPATLGTSLRLPNDYQHTSKSVICRYLHSRGLPSYLLYSIFQGELSRYAYSFASTVTGHSLTVLRCRFSPTRIAKELTKKLDKLAHSSKAAFMFPPTILVHGTADVTMPSQASVDFGQALKDIGVMVDVELHLGKTHTGTISLICSGRRSVLLIAGYAQTAFWRTYSWATTSCSTALFRRYLRMTAVAWR